MQHPSPSLMPAVLVTAALLSPFITFSLIHLVASLF